MKTCKFLCSCGFGLLVAITMPTVSQITFAQAPVLPSFPGALPLPVLPAGGGPGVLPPPVLPGAPGVLPPSGTGETPGESLRTHQVITSKSVRPEEIKTLDQVRELDGKMNTWRILVSRIALDARPLQPQLFDPMAQPDPRQAAMESVRVLQAKLPGAGDNRSAMETELKSALELYFIIDMQQRVRELDEIKAKLAETEAKLQERLALQSEAVDLQLKLMLREADGQGFFHKDDAASLNATNNNAVPVLVPTAASLQPYAAPTIDVSTVTSPPAYGSAEARH